MAGFVVKKAITCHFLYGLHSVSYPLPPPVFPAKMVLECSRGSCHLQLFLWILKPLGFSVQLQKESFKMCVCVCVHICRCYTQISIYTHLYIHVLFAFYIYMCKIYIYTYVHIYFIYIHKQIYRL